MVTRVDKFLGGLGADVTDVANVHATENRIAFGASMNPTANVHVTGNVHITTTLSTGGNITGGGTYTGGGTMTTGGNIVIPNDGDVGSVGATDAIQISSGGIVTFKDDIKIKDGGTIGSATTPTAITIADDGLVTVSPDVTISNTSATATVGPILTLYRNSASPADSDGLGQINFKGRNDNSQDYTYARIWGRINDASDTSEDGGFNIAVSSGGSTEDIWRFGAAAAGQKFITIPAGGGFGTTNGLDSMTMADGGVVTFADRDIHSAGITIADGGEIGSATTTDAITLASDGKVTLADDLAVTGNNIVTKSLGVAGNTAPVTGTLGGISLGTPANVVIRTAAGSGNVIIGDATATSSHSLDVRGTANTGAFTATTITALTDGGVQVPNDGNIGSAGATDAMQISSGGIVTFKDDIIIKDAGTIGSTSDPDAIAIGADGDVTLTQDLELQHDGAIISFGTNDEITLTHVHDAGLLLNDAGGSVSLQLHDASEAVSSDGSKLILTSNGVAFNMPTADGDADQVLTTNGSGTLSFAAAASGGTDPSVTLASNIDLGNLTDATKDAFGQGITVINDLLDMPFETTLATLDLGAL